MFPQYNPEHPSPHGRNHPGPNFLEGFELFPHGSEPEFVSRSDFNYQRDLINEPFVGTDNALEQAGGMGTRSTFNSLNPDLTGYSLPPFTTADVGHSQQQASGSWGLQVSGSPMPPSPAGISDYNSQTLQNFQAEKRPEWMQRPLYPAHDDNQVYYSAPADFHADRTRYGVGADAVPSASMSAALEGFSSAPPLGSYPQIPSSSRQHPKDNRIGDTSRRLLGPFRSSAAVASPPVVESISTTQANDARRIEQWPDAEGSSHSSPSSSSSLSPSSSSSGVDKPRNGEEVPQEIPAKLSRLRRRSSDPRLIATFSCNGQEGVRMDVAIKGDVLNLDDPTDNILPANFSTKPQYRFFFPGYEPYAQAKYVKRKKGYLTRAEIVRQIADVTYDFLKKMERINVEEKHEKWRVGKDGIQLENLELIALKKVLGAGLQPVFRYRQPSA